jgi:hypothetical protein
VDSATPFVTANTDNLSETAQVLFEYKLEEMPMYDDDE